LVINMAPLAAETISPRTVPAASRSCLQEIRQYWALQTAPERERPGVVPACALRALDQAVEALRAAASSRAK
jgi:hypothetical protein